MGTAPRGNAITFSGKGCELATSGYLNSSSGLLANLAACSQSCQNSAECKSVTFYASKWRSHFSTTCDNLVTLSGSTAVRFLPGGETTPAATTAPRGNAITFS